jgi:hypothetical protein
MSSSTSWFLDVDEKYPGGYARVDRITGEAIFIPPTEPSVGAAVAAVAPAANAGSYSVALVPPLRTLFSVPPSSAVPPTHPRPGALGSAEYLLVGPDSFDVAHVFMSSKDKDMGGATSHMGLWRRETGTPTSKNVRCSIRGCANDGVVGAHVYVRKGAGLEHDGYNYIVPMCQGHNKSLAHDCKGPTRCPRYMRTWPDAVLVRKRQNPSIDAARATKDDVIYEHDDVIPLTSSADAEEVLRGDHGPAEVMVVMEDCPYCDRMWSKFAARASEIKKRGIRAYVVDEAVCSDALLNAYGIEYFPTLLRVQDGRTEEFELQNTRAGRATGYVAASRTKRAVKAKYTRWFGGGARGKGTRKCGNCHHRLSNKKHSTWRDCPYRCTFKGCWHGNNNHKGKDCKKR